MQIPLPKMMRHWRERAHDQGVAGWRERVGLGLWGWFARRPALYRIAARFAVNWLTGRARGRGVFQRLPLASGWTTARDFPVPQGETFHDQWRAKRT